MKYEDVMEQKKGFKIERVNIKEETMTITVSSDWLETVLKSDGLPYCSSCGQKLDWSDDNE